MAESTMKKVLIVLFPGFNILDFAGPYETLQKPGEGKLFEVIVASETEITTSTEGAHIKRDVVLDNTLIERLPDFDILVVPGGNARPGTFLSNKETTGPLKDLISAYANLPSSSSNPQPRILLSICTAALLLGTLGIFNNGRHCTTHWASYDRLKERVAEAAASGNQKPGTVIPARFVDSGLNSHQVRIISSGGISCGIDASLHIIKLLCGEQEAIDTAALLDYGWHKTNGVVIDESGGGV